MDSPLNEPPAQLLADNGLTSFYTVNLTTGAATLVGMVPIDSEVQGIAIAP